MYISNSEYVNLLITNLALNWAIQRRHSLRCICDIWLSSAHSLYLKQRLLQSVYLLFFCLVLYVKLQIIPKWHRIKQHRCKVIFLWVDKFSPCEKDKEIQIYAHILMEIVYNPTSLWKAKMPFMNINCAEDEIIFVNPLWVIVHVSYSGKIMNTESPYTRKFIYIFVPLKFWYMCCHINYVYIYIYIFIKTCNLTLYKNTAYTWIYLFAFFMWCL